MKFTSAYVVHCIMGISIISYFSVALLCPVLGNIANGAVTVTSRTVGSRATYTCNDGYRLQGDRQRECQRNGRWSGQEPVCVGMSVKEKNILSPSITTSNVAL